MNSFKIICGILATLISMASYIPYLKDLFSRKTQPHSYTWLIWTILQITGVFAMYNSGAGIGSLALAVGAVFCLYIFILSLKYGTKNITIFDTICLTSALAATGVYVFLDNPVLSVILICLIDFIGFLPTLRKAYSEPYSETLSMFSLGVVWSGFNLIAISTYSITTTLYPACIMAANGLCAVILWGRRKRMNDEL